MTNIAVILPVFNAAATVRRAIDSILRQSLKPSELIVIDDGSTDNSFEIVSAIKDPRLRIIRHEHQGVAAAANAGTHASTAPLIARMDADDFSHPRRLEKQLQLLTSENLDVVGCKVRIVDAHGQQTTSMARYQRWINNETPTHDRITALRFVELPIVNPTILARREYFELGFRDIGFPEDYDLMLRAAAEGMQFGKIDEVLFDWTDLPNRLTRTNADFSEAAFMRCRQTHFLSGPLDGVAEVDLWGVGKTGKPWLKWLQANNISVRHAYDIDPRKIGQTIHGVEIQHPNQLAAADNKRDTIPLVIAVGAENAREKISSETASKGYALGVNAWFVA